jgi:leader peptidase (prepilin peptidase)/N-methyltransferase
VTNAFWPIVAAAALCGLIVGSFLNVVAYRVPREKSVLWPGSCCPACSTPIKARHNVPVIGYLVLRGHCHACRAPISARYPLVEAGTAVLFAGVTARFGITAQLPAYLYLAAVGVTLAIIDLDVRRLPDSIVLPSYVISVLLLLPAGARQADGAAGARALAGMCAMLTLYFALAIAYPNGLGFGDVKLAGLVGLYIGSLSWPALFLTAAGGVGIAAVSGMAAVATRRATRNMAVPLGPCLISAAVLAVFVAAPISSWYGSLMPV